MSVQPPQLAIESIVLIKSVGDDKSVQQICFQVADVSRSLASSAREVIQHFLGRCSIPFPRVDPNLMFYAACCKDAVRRGCPLRGAHSIRPFIRGGVAMATTAYAHLADAPTRLYIALYTAFLIYLDDVFQTDVRAVRTFNARFVCAAPQENPVLDALAVLLRELPARFGAVPANIMMTSTLNLVTALLIEDETRGMALSPAAHTYPTFTRGMSGASDAYALFIFAQEMPVTSYIQAFPDIVTYIDSGNDVLSFYKEELAGDTLNRVSLLAQCHGVSKQLVVQHLADDAVAAHERVLRTLEAYPDAHAAYVQFSHGYVGFHAALARYRLGELSL